MESNERKTYEIEHTVDPEQTIGFLGPGVTPVLSTPALVMWMEMACRDMILPSLDKGEDTVGMFVNIKHLAATPLGMVVRIIARLTNTEGRLRHFAIEAYDEKEKIGEAEHERIVINIEKFGKRLLSKASQK